MYKKIIATFLVSLVLFFLLFQFFFSQFRAKQERREARQTSIILENVQDRFKHFLDTPSSIAVVGAEYLKEEEIGSKNYSILFQKILGLNKDIIGVNLMNPEGKIIKVEPYEDNSKSLGKTTQNIKALKESLAKGEELWLSPPFKLYQGPLGFVIYVPIFNQNHFKGWLCSVISTELFMRKFSLFNFLKYYDLSIKDENTNLPYFTTGMPDGNESRVYRSKTTLNGRSIVFETWKKEEYFNANIEKLVCLILSIIAAIAVSYMVRLSELRRSMITKLQDVQSLLNLTAKDVLHGLIEEQSKLKNASVEHVTFLTNLVEQVDLLQMMTKPRKALTTKKQLLLPILKSELSVFEQLMDKKNIKLNFPKERLKNISVTVNGSLFQSSVISGVLSHLIIHAAPDSTVNIKIENNQDQCFLIFHSPDLRPDDVDSLTFDRRMEVAKKVLNLYEGDLYMQSDLQEGMIIRMVLPQ